MVQVGGGSSCQDIDECATGDNGGCDSLCINSPGAYSCACHSGYSLLLDGRTCVDIDECSGRGGGFGEAPCNGGTCINLSDATRFQCLCPPGWSGKYCEDVTAVLMGGRDFIIVFVFCIMTLLSK